MYTCFTELVQRIFKYGDLRYAVLLPFFVITYRSYALLKWVSFDTVIVVVVVVDYFA